ncbi:MAG: TetR/AcrR family transcriptional regulator [Fibrobacterota bacterium]
MSSVRKKILAAASENFRKHGIRRTSIECIAGESGISKKTVYVYFDSKNDIVKTLAERLRKDLEELFGEMDSPTYRFEDAAGAFAEMAFRIFPSYGLNFLQDIYRYFKEEWNELEKVRKRSLRKMGRLIEKGKIEGRIRKEIEPSVVVNGLIAFVDRVGNPEFLIKNGLGTETVFDTIKIVFLEGLYVRN